MDARLNFRLNILSLFSESKTIIKLQTTCAVCYSIDIINDMLLNYSRRKFLKWTNIKHNICINIAHIVVWTCLNSIMKLCKLIDYTQTCRDCSVYSSSIYCSIIGFNWFLLYSLKFNEKSKVTIIDNRKYLGWDDIVVRLLTILSIYLYNRCNCLLW